MNAQSALGILTFSLLLVAPSFGGPLAKPGQLTQAQQCAVEFYELSSSARQNIARTVPRADREGMTAYEKKMADVLEDLLYVDESTNGEFLTHLLRETNPNSEEFWDQLKSKFDDVHLEGIHNDPEKRRIATDLVEVLTSIRDAAPAREWALAAQNRKALKELKAEYYQWLKENDPEKARNVQRVIPQIIRVPIGFCGAVGGMVGNILLGATSVMDPVLSVAAVFGSLAGGTVFAAANRVPLPGTNTQRTKACLEVDREFYAQRLAPRVRRNLLDLQQKLLSGALEIAPPVHLPAMPGATGLADPGKVQELNRQISQTLGNQMRRKLHRSSTDDDVMAYQKGFADQIGELLDTDAKFADHAFIKAWLEGKSAAEETEKFETLKSLIPSDPEPRELTQSLEQIRQALLERKLSADSPLVTVASQELVPAGHSAARVSAKKSPLSAGKKLSELISLDAVRSSEPSKALVPGEKSIRQAYRFGLEIESLVPLATSKGAELNAEAGALSGAVYQYISQTLPQLSKQGFLGKIRGRSKAAEIKPADAARIRQQVLYFQDQITEMIAQLHDYEAEVKVLGDKLGEFSTHAQSRLATLSGEAEQGLNSEFANILQDRAYELGQSSRAVAELSTVNRSVKKPLELMLDNLKKLQNVIQSGSLQRTQNDGGVQKLMNQTMEASRKLEDFSKRNLNLD